MITENYKNLTKNNQIESNYQMSDIEFCNLRGFIYDECGINLNENKKIMLISRLHKRLKYLGIGGFRQYYDYVNTVEGQCNEVTHMINAVTTNKTEFFRGEKHFEILPDFILPELVLKKIKKYRKKIKIWSAGCSTGEEPYSIAMTLAEFFSKNKIKVDYSILSSDLCTDSLTIAASAIYSEESISSIPMKFIKKYFLRGKGQYTGFSRVIPELRNHINFKHINLMDNDFKFNGRMDIIFCCNVVIYFDKETQQKLFEKFYNLLVPGGYLFIGHSETLNSINQKFKYIRPSVYRKPGSD